MIYPILIHPDPRLKTICKPVVDFSSELRQLADDMLETMYDAPGVGLAAPQIGVMKRLFVMDCVKDGDPEPIVMVNPQIIETSEELFTYEEGCLSIPEQYAEITRPATVKIIWCDVHGKEQERVFSKLWATCAQHEIDHLNGKLFVDYLTPLKRQMVTRKMQKYKREMSRTKT